MANVTIEIKGLAEVNRRLTEIAETNREAFARALHEEAEIEMTESKRRVPVGETGALRESGRVEDVEGGVRLVYGDASVDYAIVQHEELEFFHTVGEAKYLERPVLESLPYLAERVANRMKRITGAG